MRKIMVFIFAVVIFTGTVGINVFAHFCKVDGVNYSYILPPSHDCGTEKAEVKTEKSCCHAPKVKISKAEFKKNCCQEEITSFKISSDYIQKSIPGLVLEFIPAQPVSCVFYEEARADSRPYLSCNVTRPPPKTGQEILILHQVFRI